MILDEGSLSDYRTNLVQNLRFLKSALEKDLRKFISNSKLYITNPFHFWDPSYEIKTVSQSTVLSKVPADVVEAMIGAFLQGGGDVSANKFLHWLGLPTVPNLYEVDKEMLPQDRKIPLHVLRIRYSTFQKQFSFDNNLPKIPDVQVFENFFGPADDPPDFSSFYPIENFEEKLGYQFKNHWLLLRAVTHPSYGKKFFNSCNGVPVLVYDYQRLEFLGDSIVNYLVVAHFFTVWNTCSPHDLTLFKAQHVSNWKLAVIAMQNLDLHKYLLFESPSVLTGIENFDFNLEATTPKFLADSFEALIGAIFLDTFGDMDLVYKICWGWLEAAGKVGGLNAKERAKKFAKKTVDKKDSVAIQPLPENLEKALESITQFLFH